MKLKGLYAPFFVFLSQIQSLKTRFILFLAISLSHFQVWSQSLDFNDPDTLTFDHETGGLIDTFDLAYSFPFSSLPSTGYSNSFQVPTTAFISNNWSLLSQSTPTLLKNKVFSGLPHIGFAYSFGLKGTQYLHADYQHSLRKNTLLNASIDRHSSGGYAANNTYANNVVRLGIYRNYKRIRLSLRGTYSGDNRGLNDGIDTADYKVLGDSLGIEFATVRNANAASEHKGVNSELSIQYNLFGDSTIVKLGPMFKSNFSLTNRVYTNDIISLRDQYQDAKISNGAGVFLNNKTISFDALVLHNYWRFQNLGTNRDSNEISFHGDFLIKRNRFALEANYYQNIIGAKQELDFKSRFRIGGETLNGFAFANFSDVLPTPLQRNYIGEYINYTTSLNKQKRLNIGGGVNYSSGKFNIQAKAGMLNTSKNLVWDWTDSTWTTNSNSTLNLVHFNVKSHLDFGIIHWYPQVSIQSGSEYLPQYIISGRLLIKKKVFEAKKLELQFSIDPQVNSTYKLLGYNINLDNYFFNPTNRTAGLPYSVHSTFSLGIEEFRFFIRGENIHTFWTKGSTEVLQNYYSSPFVLRLGLSWDFFN